MSAAAVALQLVLRYTCVNDNCLYMVGRYILLDKLVSQLIKIAIIGFVQFLLVSRTN